MDTNCKMITIIICELGAIELQCTLVLIHFLLYFYDGWMQLENTNV